MKLSWIGLCLAAVLAGGLLAENPAAAAEPPEVSGQCLGTSETLGEGPLHLARMDPSKCIIWCRIKRGDCAEDCAATAADKLKACKQGCLATFEACIQRCS